MRNKISALFEAFVYYIIYFFSGLIGNMAAVVVATVIVGFEYVSNHMTVENTVFFDEVMSLVKSEVALGLLLADIAVLLIYFLAFRSKNTKLTTYAGMCKFNLISAVAAIVTGVVAHVLIADILASLMPVVDAVGEYHQKMEWVRVGNLWLLLIVTLIVAPVVEEIVFRGVLMTSLKKVITPIGALIVTSVLFGVAHGDIVQGIYSFVLGLILGFIRIRSGSLWNCIFMHIAFNATNAMRGAFGFSFAAIPIWQIALALCILLAISSRPIKSLKK